MIVNQICTNSLKNFGLNATYSKIYRCYGQYFKINCITSTVLLHKSYPSYINYSHVTQLRYSHQEKTEHKQKSTAKNLGIPPGVLGDKIKKPIDVPLEKGKISEPMKTTQPAPLSLREKLKKAVKEYGSIVIVFHVGISLISLGTCYLLVSAGLDVPALFTYFGLKDWFSNNEIASSAGTFAISYAVHKVFAPVRIGITLVSVPFIVRYLRKIGFLKK
ncbi:unnamed protein product [Phyllotreta striolata]|uniref:DUF1279 domain-containing protein n=1 Tax=Phyllotreta striolata TaxID=444603 RepID=A0A9N9XP37_PHYSR|nr:unnamed protein product [Phyllotreta striolata]